LQNALLLMACTTAWGLAVFLMKIAGQGVGPYTSAVFALPGYLIITSFVFGRADYHISRPHWAAMGVGALYVLGNMAYYKLAASVDVSRLAPVTAMYVLIPVVLGWLFLREPITTQRIIGILLAVGALYFLPAPD